mgnify:CR=1 FL=1|tara:strand:+ start:270 stop:569 length:300 start_codon:yes stop_codon:yes gene_type:complete
MVIIIFQKVKEVADILTIENITVFGIMCVIIGFLIYEKERTEKRVKEEHEQLKEAIKTAQKELRSEFKETNADLKIITEKYHIFTVQVFEKLKSIINAR